MKTVTSLSILLLLISGVFMSALTQDKLDRNVRPKPQPVPKIQLPEIQKATLKNGLSVWLVEYHKLPIAAFNLVFQTGSEHDPLAKAGLASMTADVLDAGTKSRTALQIAEELEFIGANLRVNAFTDGSSVTLNTLTKHLDKALDIFGDVVVNATFPEKEFDRLKKQRMTSLMQQKDRAATIATLSFNKIVYGNDHPYGLNSSGTEASIKDMTREDLVGFYGTYYRPNNATLIIVGDVTMKEMLAKLEPLLASWKSGTIPPAAFPPTPAIQRRKLFLIDKPGAPQSEIRIGCPAVARSTPDFFAINLMNWVLGGQFSSRINMNLREKHGFTYGARSGFSFSKQPGPFIASAGVTTSKTDSSVQEFLYEIDKMHADGLTAAELDFVKKGLTGTFVRNFETPGQIAGSLQNVVLYNLPDDYYVNYLLNINNVTLEEANATAKNYLDSSKMDVVVVGDLKVVKEGLEKLKLGETVMCDVNGNKLTK